MSTMHEDFYAALPDTPVLPADVFPGVTGRIRRRKVVIRSLIAVAMTTVLSMGALGLVNRSSTDAHAVPNDVAEELQVVRDYLNANDVEEEYDQFVLLTEAVYQQ